LRFSGEQQGSRKATLGVQYHRSAQSLVEVGGGYRSSHNARFYGIGPYTVEDDESYYRREVAWGGVSWHRTLAQDFSVEVGAILSGVSAGGSDHSDEPHLSEEFAGELPTGYRDRSDGSTVSLELAHDAVRTVGPPSSPWRDRARPESGGIRRLRASWFDGVAASKAAFLTWRAEAQQFVPLWHTKRALALRGVLSKIENDRRVGVPFQRLLSNDGADLLRGYPEGRFHGLGLATVSAEYRWPLWNDEEVEGWGADGYLFVDYGQVFDDFEVLQTSRVKGSWGGGVRFGGYGLFLGRIEAGASDEGVEFRLQAEQIFQYAKGGLYSGRDPVPDR
jgi:outer membrane protein assembly factor BamA